MADTRSDKYISAADLDALLRAHDGDVALLYLYLLRQPGAEAEQAAGELLRTLHEIDAAWEKLRRMGLAPGEGAQVPAAPSSRRELLPPAEELPQYSAAEISRLGRSDPGFAAVLDEAAKIIGRSLSGNDMRILMGVYSHLGLPPEVILELLNFVGEVYREKYGEGRRPTARAIEKEAYTWVNQELLTLEQAEDYIRRRRQLRSDLGRVQSLLGIRGRELSATEQKYVEGWLAMGFGDEALAIALDRTLVKTGKLAWKYMDAILRDWHQKGLHEPREIEERDGRRAPVRKSDKPMSIDELRKAIEKI